MVRYMVYLYYYYCYSYIIFYMVYLVWVYFMENNHKNRTARPFINNNDINAVTNIYRHCIYIQLDDIR